MTSPGERAIDTDEEPPPRAAGSRQAIEGVAPSIHFCMAGASVRRVADARAGDTSRCAGRSYGGVRPSSV